LKLAAHLVAALTLTLVACPSEDKQGGSDTTTADTVEDTTSATEVSPDVALDTTTTDTQVDVDTGPPPPGELGSSCDDDDECFAAYCLEGKDGGLCSRSCQASCANGWACRQNVAVLPDVAFVCMPPYPTYCRPCHTNGDCLTDYDSTAHACVPQGDAGAFCGAVCASDDDCPSEAFCSQVVDIAGNTSRQCVPAAGECTCSAPAIEHHDSTDCATANTFGRCLGGRSCTSDGLTECDAATPAVDVCNGIDDNCDGRTDEAYVVGPCDLDNEFGTCPGLSRCAGASGVVCEGVMPDVESCNGRDDDCDGQTDEENARGCSVYYADQDQDTYGLGPSKCLCRAEGAYTATRTGDCNDNAKKVHPDAVETCNGSDDDCDGQTDEQDAVGCTVFHKDQDDDHFGSPSDTKCLCAAADPYDTRDASDCNDLVATINPSRLETCNGVDDDCDGQTDEEGASGCSLFFQDNDHDSYGQSAAFRCACAASSTYTASRGGDCDDGDDTANPSAPELCDALDNDCDGLTDEPNALGCEVVYRDGDHDGFGLAADSQCLCDPQAPYDAAVAGDCADGEARANPDAHEVCDGLDNDCDGTVDEPDAEGCTVYYQDRDKDQHGIASASACLCAPLFPFTEHTTDDCDDNNPFIFPGGTEICNGIDDDCDAETDEGVTDQCSLFYKDTDHDGWGVESQSECLCRPDVDNGFTTNRKGDCDDTRVDVYPLAEELCNGVDDDCDGVTDEPGALGCTTFYKDADHDGAGLVGDTRCLCAGVAPYTATVAGDCNDANDQVAPGKPEVCNSVDDDCDQATDEVGATGCDQYLRDTDGDGYGIALDETCLCAPNGVYRATVGGDCDDLQVTIHPNASEVCDGVDNDCNGVADDPNLPGCTTYYRDVDGDTYGDNAQGASQCLCAAVGTYTATRAGDCADLLPNVKPNATERCNTIDDDCDGLTDETNAVGCTSWLEDQDGDSFGVTGDARCECRAGPLYRATLGGDCNDNDANLNPGETDVCNGKDDNCDGQTDPDGAGGCNLRFKDADRDGYGVSEDQRCLCTIAAPYDTAIGGDCNDASTSIGPGATEKCNGVDDDCDGLTDEQGAQGCTTYYLDADGDKYGVTGQTLCLCSPQAAYSATVGGDCADGDARRTPGKPELCNGIDDDCDNQTDEQNAQGCVSYWVDADHDTYGVDNSQACLCAPIDDFAAIRGGDCDDTKAAKNPAQTEICDSLDNNCNGVVDESSCGTPTVGWPTFMYTGRRTGQTFAIEGPSDAMSALIWKRVLDASVKMESSPVIDSNGRIDVLLGNKVYQLDAATGAIRWTTTLPATAYVRASPSLRVGASILAPNGNNITALTNDGAIIWTRTLTGAASDKVMGAPLVDQSGRIFVVTSANVHELRADGTIAWTTAITNTTTHPSDPALGLDSRLYFAGSQYVYSFSLSGTKTWQYCVLSGASCDATKVPRASLTVNEVGRLLVPLGDTLYTLSDIQTGASIISSRQFAAGLTIWNTPAIYSDAIDSDNPAEWPVATPNGANGLQLLKADLTVEASKALFKKDGNSGTPVIDSRGNIFLGSNGQQPTDKATFSARRNRRDGSRGDAYWSFTADGRDIDGAAAIGNRAVGATTVRYVVFGDSSGTLYSVGK